LPPIWLAASRDQEVVVSAQGRDRHRHPRRGAESAGSLRALHASLEELAAWEAALDQNGIPGLRVTRLQIYRDAPLRKKP